MRLEAQRAQALELHCAGVRLAHRDAVEDTRVGAREADRPVAAVCRGTEDGIGAVRQAREPGVEQGRA